MKPIQDEIRKRAEEYVRIQYPESECNKDPHLFTKRQREEYEAFIAGATEFYEKGIEKLYEKLRHANLNNFPSNGRLTLREVADEVDRLLGKQKDGEG